MRSPSTYYKVLSSGNAIHMTSTLLNVHTPALLRYA